jgi:uncharacterized protein with HEPN domain
VKDDGLYLVHIEECISRIEEYTGDGREFFVTDRKTQDAVLRNLHTLSESTQRLSAELKSCHPEIDWQAIAGFRNVVVHDYLGISLSRIWEIVTQQLPELKAAVSEMLSEQE